MKRELIYLVLSLIIFFISSCEPYEDIVFNHLRKDFATGDTAKFQEDTIDMGYGYKLINTHKYTDFIIEKNALKLPYENEYPNAFSILYKNNLMVLFTNGKYACYNKNNLKRNFDFENKLNIGFYIQNHFIKDDTLFVLTDKKEHYFFDKDTLKKYKRDQPTSYSCYLFENNKYLAYSMNGGEFGGSCIFYDKLNNNSYSFESYGTYAIFEESDNFIIYSHLRHMSNEPKIKILYKDVLAKAEPIDSIINSYDQHNITIDSLERLNFDLIPITKINGKQYYYIYPNEQTYISETPIVSFINKKTIKLENLTLIKRAPITEKTITKYRDSFIFNSFLYNLNIFEDNPENKENSKIRRITNHVFSIDIIEGNKIKTISWVN